MGQKLHSQEQLRELAENVARVILENEEQIENCIAGTPSLRGKSAPRTINRDSQSDGSFPLMCANGRDIAKFAF